MPLLTAPGGEVYYEDPSVNEDAEFADYPDSGIIDDPVGEFDEDA